MQIQPEEIISQIRTGARRKVEDLLADGWDPNTRDEWGRTALMYAISDLEGADADVVSFLVQAGSDPSIADSEQQWTALHFAARDNRSDIVRILLQSHAAIDPIDAFGNTPLWRCVMNCGEDLSTVRTLLSTGASPVLKNFSGNSPIDIAVTCGNRDLENLLKQYVPDTVA